MFAFLLAIQMFLAVQSSESGKHCYPAFGVFCGEEEITSSVVSIHNKENKIRILEKTNCLGEIQGMKFQLVTVPNNGNPGIRYIEGNVIDFNKLKEIDQLPSKVFIEDIRWDSQRGSQTYSLFFKVID